MTKIESLGTGVRDYEVVKDCAIELLRMQAGYEATRIGVLIKVSALNDHKTRTMWK